MATMAGGNQQKQLSLSFGIFLLLNLSFEELKINTVLLYPKFPEISLGISHFFNQLGRHVNTTSRKSLEIQT